MSPKVVTSSHAEDVGGVIVEPGQPIPKGADPETVKRLEAEGRIGDEQKSDEKEKD